MNASLRYLPVSLLLLAASATAQVYDPSPQTADTSAQSAQAKQAEADARRAEISARNARYVAAVERAALRRGVELHWVNPPPVEHYRASADTLQTR